MIFAVDGIQAFVIAPDPSQLSRWVLFHHAELLLSRAASDVKPVPLGGTWGGIKAIYRP